MAGGDLCAVLLGNTLPAINRLLTGQIVELLSTKPFAPITVPLAAIASDTSTA